MSGELIAPLESGGATGVAAWDSGCGAGVAWLNFVFVARIRATSALTICTAISGCLVISFEKLSRVRRRHFVFWIQMTLAERALSSTMENSPRQSPSVNSATGVTPPL